jgi:hypothetical protein
MGIWPVPTVLKVIGFEYLHKQSNVMLLFVTL